MTKSNTVEVLITAKDLTGRSIKSVNRGIDSIKKSIGGVTSKLFNLKTAFAGIGAGLLAKNVIETKNEFVKYQKTLEVLTKSTVKASKVWGELLQFAEETPFKITEVMDSYKTLKAYGLDPTIRTMTALGDASAALGGGGVMERIAVQLGQIIATGKLTAMDIRALGNAGVNAGNVMAEAFGVASDELEKLGQKGISGEQIVAALIQRMERDFGGQMAAMNKELSGQWEMSISIWERFTVKVMDSDIYDYLNAGLTLFNEQLIKLRKTGALDKWAEEIAEKVLTSLESMAMGLAGFWDVVQPILNKLKEAVTGLWDWFKTLPGWVQQAGLILAIFGGIKARLGIAFFSLAIPKIKELIKITKEYNALGGTGGVLGAMRTTKSQLTLVDKRIAKFRKQIELQKKLIEQDKENIAGWRGKIVGAKKYQDQAEKGLKRLKELETDLAKNPYYTELIKRKAILEKIIASPKPEKEATADALNALGIPAGAELESELSKTQKKVQLFLEKIKALIEKNKNKKEIIDDSTSKGKEDKATQAGIPLSAIGIQKSILTRLLIDNKLYFKDLEQIFANGGIAVNKYYDGQVKKITAIYNEKVKLLNLELEVAKNADEKKAIEDSLYILEKEHQIVLLDLAKQRIDAEDALFQKKKEAEELLQVIKDRTADSMKGDGIEAQMSRELAQMDVRHAAELASLSALIDDKAAIKDAARAQELEKEQLFQDQKKRLKQHELAINAQMAGTMANIMGQAYEISGKKAKAFFYAQKAFAIAQAIISANLAAAKTLGQTGAFGIPLSYMVYAQAMMNVAMIATQNPQGYAVGGKIRGSSSSDSADNIPIMATAGEYVQPVKTVRYYGSQVMEAIRKRLIPRELFLGLSMPAFAGPNMSYAFADGGQVPAQAGGAGESSINIINVTDPREIDQYLASSAGQNAILNVLSSRAGAVRRVMR